MSPNDPRTQTPTPRDHDVVSVSEMMPFRSSRIKLWKSPLFMLAVLSALVTPFLFGLVGPALEGSTVQARMGAMITTGIVAVFFLLMIIQVAIYAYVKPGRSFFIYMISFLMVNVILFTPLSAPFFFVFREVLPGNIDPNAEYSFPVKFIKMFFAAGLMEELLKAVPILIGAALTLTAVRSPALLNNIAYKLLRVRGPVDGVVMGMFAGGGFIFMETAFDYIPRFSKQVLEQTNDPSAAVAIGLLLLLPRVFGGLVGHMAYSGLFGYFIGLAVVRPAQKWKLLAIGWLSSSVVHALWNSVDAIAPILNYAVAGICAIGVVACVLKARQMEAAVPGAAPLETSGSILVEPSRRAPQAAAVFPTAAPFAGAAPAPVLTPIPAQPSTSTSQSLVLDIDGFIIPLRAAGRVEPSAEPALAGRGVGVVGDIVAHPSRPGVLGLRNAGATTWTAQLRDGGFQTIERDQNVRLAPGVAIDFGGGLSGRVRAA